MSSASHHAYEFNLPSFMWTSHHPYELNYLPFLMMNLSPYLTNFTFVLWAYLPIIPYELNWPLFLWTSTILMNSPVRCSYEPSHLILLTYCHSCDNESLTAHYSYKPLFEGVWMRHQYGVNNDTCFRVCWWDISAVNDTRIMTPVSGCVSEISVQCE